MSIPVNQILDKLKSLPDKQLEAEVSALRPAWRVIHDQHQSATVTLQLAYMEVWKRKIQKAFPKLAITNIISVAEIGKTGQSPLDKEADDVIDALRTLKPKGFIFDETKQTLTVY